MKEHNQTGSLHLGVLLAVVVIAGIIFAGYRVWSNQGPTDRETTAAAVVPSAIHSQADLTQTSKALDETDTQLDASLNDSSLDSDIDSML